MLHLHLIRTVLLLAYEEDPNKGADDANKGNGDDANKGDQNKKTFTQDEVNRIVAENTKKTRQQQQSIIAELEALRSSSNITQQQRDELSTRIETLQSELLTKEELSKQRETKLKKEADGRIATLESELGTWKNRFTTSTIQRSITDAAVSADAYAPSQIVAILERNTKLVEVLDPETSKPTGNFQAMVDFEDTDKDGKPVKLSLSPKDAVKRMKELEGYQNLFKGTGTGGTGSQNRGSGGRANIAELAKDPAAYRKARAEGKIQL